MGAIYGQKKNNATQLTATLFCTFPDFDIFFVLVLETNIKNCTSIQYICGIRVNVHKT